MDRVSLGGSLAANVHGRGLRFPPIISDVESFVLMDAQSRLHWLPTENPELFGLAIGGYGLFGVIAQVNLRRRGTRHQGGARGGSHSGQRFLPSVDKRIEQGFVYGDCQYSTDLATDAASHPGVFSCYWPVDAATPIPEGQRHPSDQDWAELYTLARTDKKKAVSGTPIITSPPAAKSTGQTPTS